MKKEDYQKGKKMIREDMERLVNRYLEEGERIIKITLIIEDYVRSGIRRVRFSNLSHRNLDRLLLRSSFGARVDNLCSHGPIRNCHDDWEDCGCHNRPLDSSMER